MKGPAALLACLLASTPAVADGLDRAVGKTLFERLWVPAPASTGATDGLGPFHDARSCAACHPAWAGAARLHLERDGSLGGLGLTLRLADDPVYGRQLQRMAVPTLAAEASWRLLVSEGPPQLVVDQLASGRLTAPAGARTATDLRGLTSLERVPDSVILARADPDDADGDGISGRANHDPRTGRLGRFGHKAVEPDLAAQTETAFLLDLGLATPGWPWPAGDCTPEQTACLAAPQGAEPGTAELPAGVVDSVVAYLRALPPPAKAPEGAGKHWFAAAGCASCHALELAAVPAGTDLLLHDLGPGLADGVAEGTAHGAEWRTAPLAGIGRRLAAGARLLHDGRAGDVGAAVGWHDGEAAAARTRFGGLRPDEREALVAWLKEWR
jgi:CxxC motif-containing protein (DUF1111 family)